MAAVACNAMEREYDHATQPTNGAMAANMSDNEVTDGKYGCPHFGEGNLVDIPFQYRSGESSHDVKKNRHIKPT